MQKSTIVHWKNPLFQWQFSIVMWIYQMVNPIKHHKIPLNYQGASHPSPPADFRQLTTLTARKQHCSPSWQVGRPPPSFQPHCLAVRYSMEDPACWSFFVEKHIGFVQVFPRFFHISTYFRLFCSPKSWKFDGGTCCRSFALTPPVGPPLPRTPRAE